MSTINLTCCGRECHTRYCPTCGQRGPSLAGLIAFMEFAEELDEVVKSEEEGRIVRGWRQLLESLSHAKAKGPSGNGMVGDESKPEQNEHGYFVWVQPSDGSKVNNVVLRIFDRKTAEETAEFRADRTGHPAAVLQVVKLFQPESDANVRRLPTNAEQDELASTPAAPEPPPSAPAVMTAVTTAHGEPGEPGEPGESGAELPAGLGVKVEGEVYLTYSEVSALCRKCAGSVSIAVRDGLESVLRPAGYIPKDGGRLPIRVIPLAALQAFVVEHPSWRWDGSAPFMDPTPSGELAVASGGAA